MKKFLLFIILAIGFVTVQAQTVLSVDKYIYQFTGSATDTVGAVSTTWSKAILLNKQAGLYYNASVKVSDVTAGAKCSVKLQGKIFESDDYTDITAVTWYGGGTDSTILFTGNTNKIYYRYLRFYVTRVAAKAKISNINLSLKK